MKAPPCCCEGEALSSGGCGCVHNAKRNHTDQKPVPAPERTRVLGVVGPVPFVLAAPAHRHAWPPTPNASPPGPSNRFAPLLC